MLPVEDMTLPLIAEELGALREEISLLKAREADLREAIVRARPNNPLRAGGYEVELHLGQSRRLDRDSLPAEILGDPRYWVTTKTATVLCRRRRAGSQDDAGGADQASQKDRA